MAGDALQRGEIIWVAGGLDDRNDEVAPDAGCGVEKPERFGRAFQPLQLARLVPHISGWDSQPGGFCHPLGFSHWHASRLASGDGSRLLLEPAGADRLTRPRGLGVRRYLFPMGGDRRARRVGREDRNRAGDRSNDRFVCDLDVLFVGLVDADRDARQPRQLFQPLAGERIAFGDSVFFILADRPVLLHAAWNFCAAAECSVFSVFERVYDPLHPPHQRIIRLHFFFAGAGIELFMERPRKRLVGSTHRHRGTWIHQRHIVGG